MHILSEEFSRQASMENELQIPSSLMAPPKQDMASLAKAQLSFMNLFAIPLFQGVADIMPAMEYTVEELEINKSLFERKVDEEKAKLLPDDPVRKRLLKEGTFSPRTMSFAAGMEETTKEPTAMNNTKLSMTLSDMAEEQGATPTSLVDGQEREEEALDPPPSRPTQKPAHIPSTNEEYKEVNGRTPALDAVRQLANSNPFNVPAQGGSSVDGSSTIQGKHRSSEATDGSLSGAFAGDWASQATSAATGKVPKSPSTKGTSIVSKDSEDRPISAAGAESTHRSTPESARTFKAASQHSPPSTESSGKADGKTIRKKPSRFRMKDFPFFRRHKGSNPAAQTTDMTG